MQTQAKAMVFLNSLLLRRVDEKAMDWLKTKSGQIQQEGNSSRFFLAFSQASRFFKKNPLELSDFEQAEAAALTDGFDPSHWDLLQAARTVLLLSFPLEKESWFAAVNQLFETADMHEHQALFAALPLMPFPEDLVNRAIDGCRTNVSLIFDAIALNNPYPPRYFPEANWNQLVLKAIFMQRPLYRIQQLEARRNQALADIASDFAHERWAAGRDVMPELWRLTVPFIDEGLMADLTRVVQSEDPLESEAGLLAVYQSPYQPAKDLLKAYPETVMAIEYGEITWEKIGRDFQEKRS